MVLAGNRRLTSQGLHAVFKCDLLATAGYYCLSNLMTNVLRTTECNCTCSLKQETHMYRVWLPAFVVFGLSMLTYSIHGYQQLWYLLGLSMLSIHSPDYVMYS